MPISFDRNVLTESFGRFFFWSHILQGAGGLDRAAALLAGLGWAGLCWGGPGCFFVCGWALGKVPAFRVLLLESFVANQKVLQHFINTSPIAICAILAIL